jgi:plastocyanin
MKTKLYTIFVMIIAALVSLHQEAKATIHTVQSGNFFFNPNSLNVTVGDTIKWVNTAGSHTTTSSNIPSGAATWDANLNSSTPTFLYKVTVAGTYDYVCTPHISMGMVGSFTASNPTNTLAVTPGNQNVGAASGNTSFNVASNTSWSASCSSSWCSCTPSGTGNGVITATYSANTSTLQRVATITVSASGVASQNVTVTQAGAAPTLTVSPSSQSVTTAAGTVSFTVSSNTSWTASSDQTWCTVTPSGSGNGTIVATYQANNAQQRTATISVNVTGLPTQTVTVIQDASNVGINEQDASSLAIYPNPVRTGLTISSSAGFDRETEVNIYNVNSVKVMGPVFIEGKLSVIDLSELQEGVYFVRVGSDKGSPVRKIVKVR